MTEHHHHGHEAERQHVHPRRPDMLSVEEALARVLALVDELPSVKVALLEADGQTLAEDVRAPFDIPSLANSAMDGYAVRVADLAGASEAKPVTLKVVGQVQAGQLPGVPVTPGTAVRIMTGAPVPGGADAIVPYELTDEVERRQSGQPVGGYLSPRSPLRVRRGEGGAGGEVAERSGTPSEMDEIAIKEEPVVGQHVRPAGEDAARGALILSKGRVLDPPSIGMLASVGIAEVRVVRRPKVAIFATGDEVLVPGEAPQPGKLFDSNSYGVAAAVRRWGGVPQVLGVAHDNMAELRDKLRLGLDADLLITSAGVSAGAFDMVKEVLSELGKVDFWAVRMRPARPIAFGLLRSPDGREVPHLGLPGNPVSALVAMVEFGRPAIGKMMGREPAGLPRVTAVLDEAVVNSDGRRVYARVTLQRRQGVLHASLTGGQGSNLLTSMVLAEGLAICPEDVAELQAGSTAPVEVLDWIDHSRLLSIVS